MHPAGFPQTISTLPKGLVILARRVLILAARENAPMEDKCGACSRLHDPMLPEGCPVNVDLQSAVSTFLCCAVLRCAALCERAVLCVHTSVPSAKYRVRRRACVHGAWSHACTRAAMCMRAKASAQTYAPAPEHEHEHEHKYNRCAGTWGCACSSIPQR